MTTVLSLERVNILGVGVSAIDIPMALSQIEYWIQNSVKTYVIVRPVYSVMLCQADERLRSIVNRAGMVTPDGMPLVFLSRWRGFTKVDRVYGPDLMLAFNELAAQKGYSSFFYGGAEGVPELLAKGLSGRFPGLKITGTFSPPFRPLTPAEDGHVVDMINAANPDVVWVGLGSPKQDYWMADHRERLNAPVLIGVGAAFNFHTGQVRQAPKWMQRSALEWLFRLMMEPRRLWRRYLIYNPLFILNVMMQTVGLKTWTIED
jgi:N-acetylglucosaminyldiphosphoundecaprenol N-acetyl-beta-D-mannosaminyltransferase